MFVNRQHYSDAAPGENKPSISRRHVVGSESAAAADDRAAIRAVLLHGNEQEAGDDFQHEIHIHASYCCVIFICPGLRPGNQIYLFFSIKSVAEGGESVSPVTQAFFPPKTVSVARLLIRRSVFLAESFIVCIFHFSFVCFDRPESSASVTKPLKKG